MFMEHGCELIVGSRKQDIFVQLPFELQVSLDLLKHFSLEIFNLCRHACKRQTNHKQQDSNKKIEGKKINDTKLNNIYTNNCNDQLRQVQSETKIVFTFLEHAEELRIIILRREKWGQRVQAHEFQFRLVFKVLLGA